MKSNTLYVLLLALSVLATGCGSSRSSNDDANKLRTEEEAFLQFCDDFPNSQECFNDNEFADSVGLNDYFGGGDDFFSDNAFNNAGTGCGCHHGERPVLFGRVRRCEAIATYETVARRNSVYVRYRRNHGNERVWVAFDTVNVNEYTPGSQPNGGWDDGPGSCHQDFGTRCRVGYGDSCRGLINEYGEHVQASCVAIQGTDYGYCEAVSGGPYRF